MTTKHWFQLTLLFGLLALAVIGILLMDSRTVAAQGPDPAPVIDSPGPGADKSAVSPEDIGAVRAANYLHVSGSSFIPRYATSSIA